MQEPNHWATFVATRVSEIQQIQEFCWRHVSTQESSADSLSCAEPFFLGRKRSLVAGPKWLTNGQTTEPFQPLETKEECKMTASSTQDFNANNFPVRNVRRRHRLI